MTEVLQTKPWASMKVPGRKGCRNVFKTEECRRCCARNHLAIYANTLSASGDGARLIRPQGSCFLCEQLNFVKGVKGEMTLCVLSCAEIKVCLLWFTLETFRKQLIDYGGKKKVYWLTNPIKTWDIYIPLLCMLWLYNHNLYVNTLICLKSWSSL